MHGAREPVGSWIRVGATDHLVIGVVEDGPMNHLRERIEPYLYFPFAQKPSGEATRFLETARDPGQLAAAVRAKARESIRLLRSRTFGRCASTCAALAVHGNCEPDWPDWAWRWPRPDCSE
ncbi:MAG: hypothetical protein KIT09_35390 [Bryobacteraceae bacterium]|nr:hypothetical protein [Bryobacteraceae bacterium]